MLRGQAASSLLRQRSRGYIGAWRARGEVYVRPEIPRHAKGKKEKSDVHCAYLGADTRVVLVAGERHVSDAKCKMKG